MLKFTLASMVFLLSFLAHAQTSKCAITRFDENDKLIEAKNSDYDPDHAGNAIFNVQLPSGDFEGKVELVGKTRLLTIRSMNSHLSASKENELSNDVPSLHLTDFDGTLIQLMCVISFDNQD